MIFRSKLLGTRNHGALWKVLRWGKMMVRHVGNVKLRDLFLQLRGTVVLKGSQGRSSPRTANQTCARVCGWTRIQ